MSCLEKQIVVPYIDSFVQVLKILENNKIDIILKKISEHSIEEFARRKKMEFWKGFEAFVAAPEDVIIKKLEFYRMGGSEKHLTDIRGIVAETPLDNQCLGGWIFKLSLQQEWEKAQ